jgi:hypothetical protein
MSEQIQHLGTIKSFYEQGASNKKMQIENFLETLDKGGISQDENLITPLDFFSISPEIKDDILMESIKKRLGIEGKEFSTEIGKISSIFQESKDYLENFLNIRIPQEIKLLDGFSDQNDFLKIVRKTHTIKKTDKLGLSPYYCALLKIMLAFWDYQKYKFSDLENEVEFLKKYLHEKRNILPLNQSIGYKNIDYQKVQIHNEDMYVQVYWNSRSKSKESVISKILITPELTVDEIIKDGIGIKIEVEDVKNSTNCEDIEKSVLLMADLMKNNFDLKNVKISNRDLLEEKNFSLLKEKLRAIVGEVQDDGSPNPSSGKYKVVKFVGQIFISNKADASLKKHARNIEVQIVPIQKQERRNIDHDIYKLKQKFSIMTRLFGSFSVAYFRNHITQLSKKYNTNTQTILDKIDNLVRVSSSASKKGGYRLMSSDHATRWKNLKINTSQVNLN